MYLQVEAGKSNSMLRSKRKDSLAGATYKRKDSLGALIGATILSGQALLSYFYCLIYTNIKNSL